ncbi:MAG: hypothetical protein ACN2B6_09875 [Rickettsiales bacterium]
MAPTDSDNSNYLHTSISKGFNQHTPAYWRLALPALGARYSYRWVESIFEWGKNGKTWNVPFFKKGVHSKQGFDAAAGTWMLGITGLFAYNTARDMKRIFSEAVAYELDKNPADVTIGDMMHSDNKALAKARSNFIKFNTLRAGLNATFFASFLPNTKHAAFWNSESVHLGLGANGTYLVNEVVTRNNTFFEQLQDFIDRKVNQKNALGEDIRAIELMRLFERNAMDNDKENAFKGRTNTVIWEQSQQMFERMAELMNNTYQHTSTDEKANFTLPKFLYMLGHNLIRPDKYEQTSALVEIANRYGMSDLKKVVRSLEEGTDLGDIIKLYPVEIPIRRIPVAMLPAARRELPAQDNTTFVHVVEEEEQKSMAEKYRLKKPETASFADRATASSNDPTNLSVV